MRLIIGGAFVLAALQAGGGMTALTGGWSDSAVVLAGDGPGNEDWGTAPTGLTNEDWGTAPTLPGNEDWG